MRDRTALPSMSAPTLFAMKSQVLIAPVIAPLSTLNCAGKGAILEEGAYSGNGTELRCVVWLSPRYRPGALSRRFTLNAELNLQESRRTYSPGIGGKIFVLAMPGTGSFANLRILGQTIERLADTC